MKAKFNHEAADVSNAVGIDVPKVLDRFNQLADELNVKIEKEGARPSHIVEVLENTFSKRELAFLFADSIRGDAGQDDFEELLDRVARAHGEGNPTVN